MPYHLDPADQPPTQRPGAHWPLWVRILPSRTLCTACLICYQAPKVEYVLREGEKLKNSFTILQGNADLDGKVRP